MRCWRTGLIATPPDEPPRLPAHLEVGALLRRVTKAGGFATVLHKGERDAGTILVVLSRNGAEMRLFERLPDALGHRPWTRIRTAESHNSEEIQIYIEKRERQDPDLWIVELDIAQGERFIGLDSYPG